MKQRQWIWPLVLLFSAIAAGISAFALPGTLLCLVVVLWFLVVCPGMAVVRHLNLKEPQAEWTLAIALSLALDVIVASIELYAGAWFPPGILGILITVCVVGAIGPFVLTPLASLTRTGRTGRKARSLATAFFFLVLVVPISGLGVWSYSMRTRAATTASAASNQAASPTATSAGGAVIDTIIVMDNVDHITAYDPQDDRYNAAQLFASRLPIGSSVGIVRITSTPDSVLVLALQALHTSSDRAMIINTLTANTFGPVDPTPVAYFNPALQMAGNMLQAKSSSDRKLILIFTDALALSGDRNACASSPDAYHAWFCTVGMLAQQGITIALVGFSPLRNAATLQPVQQFFATHGGIAVPVSDGPNLASQLTTPYCNLLNVATC